MEIKRKPLQGVANIVRFNWHFYAIILSYFILSFFLFKIVVLPNLIADLISFLNIIIASVVGISLLVSAYVYDFSKLYNFSFLNDLKFNGAAKIANINAGFDETSAILKQNFSLNKIEMLDFYDEKVHTEVSIKRARKLYPNSPETLKINTKEIPFPNNYFDAIFLIFAAHEIRSNEERIKFFQELNRISKENSSIIIVEHLRDLPNFLAYNIGFFHFLSLKTWKKNFENSNFNIVKHSKPNPFVNVIYLNKNGNTP
ncbi:class I SAM-dependent methyltransferase [Frigoriflavimonas asaccharolytica]|uniref:SAM-dependent methyltransferase n=1 Tax=Frigoriflavimonas asaccharolytica TaxID=2735899 RepID=A0A8J8GB51_9FLAO|nr:methyltransferase domain-containing protein [Frigoriflavimonas asaccharolytica]NRS93980.1 SAM-dependent methyltransferase [Frigoriflavimonas asaccharolytica]